MQSAPQCLGSGRTLHKAIADTLERASSKRGRRPSALELGVGRDSPQVAAPPQAVVPSAGAQVGANLYGFERICILLDEC